MGKHSPNLASWMAKHSDENKMFGHARVFTDKDQTLWLGWIDSDKWFIGTRLWRILCDGVKAEAGCWTFPVSELTEVPSFWAEYAEIGRCAIDRDHSRFFLNDCDRWTQEGDNRTCNWCGAHKQTLIKWTEMVEREEWRPILAA